MIFFNVFMFFFPVISFFSSTYRSKLYLNLTLENIYSAGGEEDVFWGHTLLPEISLPEVDIM